MLQTSMQFTINEARDGGPKSIIITYYLNDKRMRNMGKLSTKKKKNQKTQEDSNPAQNKTKKELYKRQKITAQVYVL